MWGLLRKERSEWLRSASKWSSEEGVLTGPQNPNAIWIDALICWLNSCKSSAVADEQSRLGRSASGGFWVDAMFEMRPPKPLQRRRDDPRPRIIRRNENMNRYRAGHV